MLKFKKLESLSFIPQSGLSFYVAYKLIKPESFAPILLNRLRLNRFKALKVNKAQFWVATIYICCACFHCSKSCNALEFNVIYSIRVPSKHQKKFSLSFIPFTMNCWLRSNSLKLGWTIKSTSWRHDPPSGHPRKRFIRFSPFFITIQRHIQMKLSWWI